MANGKRPGVMVYFDLRPCLKRLSYEQKGLLLDAILTYGEDSYIPEFDDPALSVAWDFVQLKIDADGERYKRRCEKAQEAANTRWGNVLENANSPNGCERIPTDTFNANHNHNYNLKSISCSAFRRNEETEAGL